MYTNALEPIEIHLWEDCNNELNIWSDDLPHGLQVRLRAVVVEANNLWHGHLDPHSGSL